MNIIWKGTGVNEKGIEKETGKIIIDINSKFFRPSEVDFLKGNYKKARKHLKWKPNISTDELIEDIEFGVYACGSRGGQVDTGRGSFQFAAQEAWIIENGSLSRPVRDVSVSGMTLEILKNVDGLTRDAYLGAPGFCGKGQTVPVGDGGPLMRIREALVG